jgi:hypothetical protein
MEHTLDWIANNAEWLFSGAAVAIPLALISWLVARKGHGQPSELPIPQSQTNITSHNQSGGITAHTVVVERAKSRTFNAHPAAISFEACAGIRIFLHQYSEDSETTTFANDLCAQLVAFGWEIIASGVHSGDPSVFDVALEVNAQLGPNDKSFNAASMLLAVLQTQRIPAVLRRIDANSLPPNSMYVRIGPLNDQ